MVHARTALATFALAMNVGAALLPTQNANAQAAATNKATASQVVFEDGTLSVHSSALNSTSELITVDLPSFHKQVSVIYPSGHSEEKLWTRLWFSQGSANLTKSEQLAVRASYNRALASVRADQQAQGDDSDLLKAKAIVDFLANFLPAGETLEPFDSKVNLPKGFLHQYSSTNNAFESRYTMICDSIGKIVNASYTTWDGHTFSKDMVVGAIDSECRGRCGAGCEQAGQWRHNQYTKECLSHDLCHNETNSQLGPCLEMFWEAAPGYLFAPDCTEKAIEIGPNIPVIIPTPPAGSTAPPQATPIPDPNPNDGSNTTPASQAPPDSKPATEFRD